MTVANEIYRVDLRTQQIDRVPEEARRVEIAPSADRTLFASHSDGGAEPRDAAACATHQLVATDISSGKTRAVASVPESLSLIVSPDDKTLYIRSCSRIGRLGNGTVKRYSHRLLAVDVSTGRPAHPGWHGLRVVPERADSGGQLVPP